MTRQPFSIREIIIPIILAALVGLATWVITKERQDTAQDVNLQNVWQKTDPIEGSVESIYKEVVIIQSGLAAVQANQNQILERLNR